MNHVKPQLQGETNRIVDMINNSDARAFAILYRTYWDRLLNFGLRYLNDSDTCEEIVQELFIQLHTQKLPLKLSASISSYLYGAMRNRILNYRRKQSIYRRHVERASVEDNSSLNYVDEIIGVKELQKVINEVVDGLPSRYREVYLLRENRHLSLKQIAAMLNRPIDTVDKQLRKVQRLLKDRVLDYKLAD